MTDETTPATAPQRVVYLGPCLLKGGKVGSMFIPEATLKAHPDDSYEVVRRTASAYAYAPSGVIGGVYDGNAEIVGDSVSRLSKQRTYRGVVDHPTIPAFEAAALAHDHQQRAAKAEKLAAKEQSALAPHIEALAAALAGIDTMTRYHVAQGLASVVVKRAGVIALERLRKRKS